jgi:glutathione S-transferase
MTSGMIVHGVPGSPYVRAALLALEEKGADYEFAAMALGALKQEPHLSRLAFGRIPAFEHDGWMLYETQAIMRYVDAVVPGPQLQPVEPRGGADEPADGHHRLVCDAAGLRPHHPQPCGCTAFQSPG